MACRAQKFSLSSALSAVKETLWLWVCQSALISKICAWEEKKEEKDMNRGGHRSTQMTFIHPPFGKVG
jgi:hypothetical protein